MSCPASVLRLTVTDFLLRDCTNHHSEVPVVHLAPRAQRIAAVGRLDLDDLRAELGEDARAERPRDERAELEDAQASERAADGLDALVECIGQCQPG